MLQLHLSDQQFYCLLRCVLYERLYSIYNSNRLIEWMEIIPFLHISTIWAILLLLPSSQHHNHVFITAITTACIAFKCIQSLRHWGRNKMAAISQTTFSNTFSWIKMYECQSNNIPSLIQIMACDDQASSHYLNQWWLRLVRHKYASLGLNELRQDYHVFNVIFNLSLGNVKHICIFHNFSTLKWQRLFRPFPLEINNPFIMHIQYYGCWCPDKARRQEINCHSIDLIIPE